MSLRHLAVPAATLLLCSACSSSSPVSDRTTAVRTGPMRLTAGEGFDASGAFQAPMTCDTPTDYSPGLGFADVPAGTAELAVSMVDLDTPKIHWLLLGLPATASGIKAHTLTTGAREALNDFKEATYDGPCPPHGVTHRYELTLYALHDAVPSSYGSSTPPEQTLHALRTNATATATLVASFARR